ncbi:MAG: dipeptidase [Lachnospirales bacterium]
MQLFDLHCDSIVRYRQLQSGFLCNETQFSLNQKKEFKRMCQTMAVFIPDDIRGKAALDYFNIHYEYLVQLASKESKLMEIALNGVDIKRITENNKCALITAIESGAALAGDLKNVRHIANCGVRMMTLVWNGENEIGSGHSTNNGITEFGREVIKEMEEEKIIVDVSHLNDVGFDDVCKIASKPFIATHSNLRSICSHKRNLTNEQFKEIVRRKGLVGINLFEPFLSDDGIGTMDTVLRHVYHMLELGGENVIACGGDFDGADVHPTLDNPEKFGSLADYLINNGIDKTYVDKMFFDNALQFFMEN